MDFYSESLGVNAQGHLTVGGADVVSLAEKYGTPAYIMSEDGIRSSCRQFTNGLRESYPGDFLVAFASKALCFKHIYRVMESEGMGVDVASGGELYTALSGGMPPDRIIFHGNNKTADELRYAVQNSIRRIVIDNREEADRLNRICAELGKKASVSFRLNPGVEAHTHELVRTGQLDSKFGMAISTGEAMAVMRHTSKLENLEIAGIHCHIGSQIFDAEPFVLAVSKLMDFYAEAQHELGVTFSELNLGGGFGIKYTNEDDPRGIDDVVKTTSKAVVEAAKRLSLPLPVLVLEPGRSISAPHGITVYTVGSVKTIPGARTYVAVDGGMTDNPRYSLYGSRYRIVLPERAGEEPKQLVSLAGRCCETDLLGKDMLLPEVSEGELLCVLATGAYNYSMSSHYNRVPKPPVIMVKDGEAFVAVKRESWEDIARLDV